MCKECFQIRNKVGIAEVPVDFVNDLKRTGLFDKNHLFLYCPNCNDIQ
jgi:hypothetical protein